jgi:alpha,alpha-trehalase
MLRHSILVVTLFFGTILSAQKQVRSPDQIYGQLFIDVELSRIFPDSKTFPDCVPKRKPELIVRDYMALKNNPAIRFSLEQFVKANFDLPKPPQTNYVTEEKDIVTHIKNLWKVLKREADKPVEGSSLLPLPNPYIVPGGRFGEIYYWDSYFTLLGLKESGEFELMQDMIDNFSYLIKTYGHIPNGNRSYYISRSQPPFFSLMVELLARVKGDSVYKKYLPYLELEYKYWMEGSTSVKEGRPFKRVVKMKDGSVLNRYWDDASTPRPEGYREDIEVAKNSGRNAQAMYKELRSGAASGIDFSSRWFMDTMHITTIAVTDMVAVDLNSLLYNLEKVLSKAHKLNRNFSMSANYEAKSAARFKAVKKYCFNDQLGYFCDYNWRLNRVSEHITPAGMYPLCVFDLPADVLNTMGRQAAKVVKEKLLKDGGIQTTEFNTGQQWDAPNGWAPLQWMTIWGFDRCGQSALAKDIATRWVNLNTDVFVKTGKLMEKYNVANIHLEAGGGEYAGQDGFGWTNGVFLSLINKYALKPPTLMKEPEVPHRLYWAVVGTGNPR